MTDEELKKDIAECFANCEGSVPIKLRHYEWANVVLNLIRESGVFMDTEMVKGLVFEVQARKCSQCPKNKEAK